MNVFDKTLLFEMSYALMRRFAFIEVPSPDPKVFAELIDMWAAGSTTASTVTKRLLPVRAIKDVGPAVYRDIAQYVLARQAIDSPSEARLVFDAFYSFILPQFEGIDDDQGRKLRDAIKGALDPADRGRLVETLNTVLGLELSQGTAVDETAAPPNEQPLSPWTEEGGYWICPRSRLQTDFRENPDLVPRRHYCSGPEGHLAVRNLRGEARA